MAKTEGIFGCTVIEGRSGDNDKGLPSVQITVQITDGPDKGQRCTYEEVISNQTNKYVAWSCKAVGWKGGPLVDDLEKDIAEWIARTGGTTTVEIKHIEIKRGDKYNKWVDGGCKGPGPVWDKVSGIGRGSARALKPMSASSRADANEAMRAVSDSPPQDDAPHASQGGYDGYEDLPVGAR
jgi:hypothetical protein